MSVRAHVRRRAVVALLACALVAAPRAARAFGAMEDARAAIERASRALHPEDYCTSAEAACHLAPDHATAERELARAAGSLDAIPDTTDVLTPLDDAASLATDAEDASLAERLYAREERLLVRFTPNDAEARARVLHQLGRLAYGRKDVATARSRMEAAYALDPFPELAVDLGVLRDQEGDRRQAIEALGRGIVDDAGTPADFVWSMRALSARALARWETFDQRGADRDAAEMISFLPRLVALATPPTTGPLPAVRNADSTPGTKGVITVGEITIVGRAPVAPALAALNDLAVYQHRRGDLEHAAALHHQALALDEAWATDGSAGVARDLANLGSVDFDRRDLAAADAELARALSLFEKLGQKGSAEWASALTTRAAVAIASGNLDAAEIMLREALAADEAARAPDSPAVATALSNRAALLRLRGDLDGADALDRRVLALRERTLGAGHPDVARSYIHLAKSAAARGQRVEAVALAAKAMEIEGRVLLRALSSTSSAQRRAAARATIDDTDFVVSLALAAPDDESAARLAATTVLRRKGVVLDADADTVASLRRRLSSDDAAILDALVAARTRVAELVLHSPAAMTGEAYHAALEAAEGSEQAAEVRASQAVSLTSVTEQPSVERAEQALAAGQALVEIVSTRRFDPRARSLSRWWSAPRYAALVVRPGGPPRWVDLGDAASIDALAAPFRTSLADPRSTDVGARGRALHAATWAKLARALGDARDVFVAPDGSLSLVPFEALVDAQGEWLAESSRITYLTSGREILRSKAAHASRAAALVMGDPQFHLPPADAGAPDGAAPEAARGGALARARFPPLPGTDEEARAVASLLGGSTLLLGARATREALFAANAPSIVHVASHGFFLGGATGGSTSSRALVLDIGERPAPHDPSEALVRSGIALAGADDGTGIVSALEAMSLDLDGTKLVVLSACETAVGEAAAGDGVYGLRRALVLAGAETEVMSLWKVDDAATRDLMVAYYRALARGEGRSGAMRQARLDLAGRPATAHPYYWASFLVAGNPDALSGRAVPFETPAHLPPAPRACACEVGDSRHSLGGAAAVLALAALAVARLLRRRRA